MVALQFYQRRLDLGGSTCERPHLSAWFCMVPCHPVHIGNIPKLIYKNVIYLQGSALFPATPCT